MADEKQSAQDLEVEEQELQDQELTVEQMAQNIVDRNTPEVKTDKKEQPKEKRSDDNEVQLTASAVKEFKELGYEIGDLEQFDAKELQGILEKQLKKEKPEVKQPELPSVPVISEELAKLDKTGFLKTMIGQPLNKMVEHISNLSEYNQRLLKERETKKPETKETDSKTTQELLDEIDFLELDPKEAAKAITKIANAAVKDALEKNNKDWEQKLSATIQPISKAAEKEALNELIEKIQNKFPKEVSAGELFNEWLKDDSMSKEAKLAVAQSEEALISVVVNYGKEKHNKIKADKDAKEIKKKSKIVIADEVRKKIKEADTAGVSGETYNAARRDEIITGDPVSDIKRKIAERNS